MLGNDDRGAPLELASEALEAIEGLPFVADTSGSLSFWNIDPVGHDDTDIRIGESYAVLALTVVKRFDVPLLLSVVLRDMIRAGRFTGLEAGFLATIACVAKAGSMN